MGRIKEQYSEDRIIWDECAQIYEERVVGGHPDIFALECFEEAFLDRVLRHVSENHNKPIKLMDIGCGSGRLHLRYGVKTTNPLTHPAIHLKAQMKKQHCELMYDPLLAERLTEVWGIDFSASMLKLAEEGIAEIGLSKRENPKLSLAEGSAFELEPEADDHFPVAVCLINSIGVMQGPDGAVALFKAMKNAVERAGGIAIISCYQREYMNAYGLNQYESTMDVSGQPTWLVPKTFVISGNVLRPKRFKRAYCSDSATPVDILDTGGKIYRPNVILDRDPELTKQTLETGHILTHSGYESNWYSFQQIEEWIEAYWGKNTYHIKTKQMDALRAEPAQLAILDCNHCLEGLWKRWNIL